MPNWCLNKYEVTGPTADVTRFADALAANPNADDPNEVSLLDTFIPRPASVDADGTWYEWSVNHWGTKWADDSRIAETVSDSDGTTTVVLHGDTAWAPPIAGIVTISEQWPTLTFLVSYSEEGMCFAGANLIARGASISECEFHEGDLDWPQCDDWDDEVAVDAYREALQTLVDRAIEVVTS
jgi:hypothetical protein